MKFFLIHVLLLSLTAAVLADEVIVPTSQPVTIESDAEQVPLAEPASEPAKDATANKAPASEKASGTGDDAVEDIEKNITSGLREKSKEAVTGIFSSVGLGKEAHSILELKIGSYTLGQLSGSFFILLVSLILRGVITKIVFKRLHHWAGSTRTKHDEALITAMERPFSWLILLIGFCLSVLILPMSEWLHEFITGVGKALSVGIVIWGMIRVIDVVSAIFADLAEQRQSPMHGFLPVLRKSSKVFVVLVGALMVVDNLGYNVSGILATLGLGGAALAFASKDTIANGFGTLMIILDRPFKVGDWIIVGDRVDGDVEEIGLRSTKVRTWPKTVLSIPNGVLANEYINNWSRMPKRRVKQYVGITYEATAEDMEGLVEDIKTILREDEGVQQDFILVNFTDFGESSLDILVYYFTQTIAWIPHMEARQRINCKIMRAVKARGLSIAFPTRSLYLEGRLASKMVDEDYSNRWEQQAGDSNGQLPGDHGPMSPP